LAHNKSLCDINGSIVHKREREKEREGRGGGVEADSQFIWK
jgi:hypothetical protein